MAGSGGSDAGTNASWPEARVNRLPGPAQVRERKASEGELLLQFMSGQEN
jgi:hypothetical protein